jgi:hypothetical protein
VKKKLENNILKRRLGMEMAVVEVAVVAEGLEFFLNVYFLAFISIIFCLFAFKKYQVT